MTKLKKVQKQDKMKCICISTTATLSMFQPYEGNITSMYTCPSGNIIMQAFENGVATVYANDMSCLVSVAFLASLRNFLSLVIEMLMYRYK